MTTGTWADGFRYFMSLLSMFPFFANSRDSYILRVIIAITSLVFVTTCSLTHLLMDSPTYWHTYWDSYSLPHSLTYLHDDVFIYSSLVLLTDVSTEVLECIDGSWMQSSWSAVHSASSSDEDASLWRLLFWHRTPVRSVSAIQTFKHCLMLS